VKIITFKPVKVPVLTKSLVEELLGREGLVHVSLDLGISKIKALVKNNILELDSVKIDLTELSKCIKDENGVYALKDGKFFKIAFFKDGSYYKLRAVSHLTAPTLEINGIHMHRIEGITPWRDAMEKVRLLKVKRCHKVLDVCTGLGYTAINSMCKGACEIYTIEKDPNVLEIASYNPWSHKLSDPRVKIVLGNAVDIVRKLPDNYFDRILHDPPRFTKVSSELYTIDFYCELYRVLKPHGRLFHYVGTPGRRRCKSMIQGVRKRLKIAGFSVLFQDAGGIICERVL